MNELHITWVDVAVVVTIGLSTTLAIFRGFVRETLSIFAWAAAVFATLYFGHDVVPLLAPHMSHMLAEILAYTGVFLLVLMPLLFLGSRLSQRVYESPIGGLDRFLGALFGAVRGLAAIAVLYILYSLVVPVPAQAQWMRDARTLPLIQKSASALLELLPDRDAEFVEARTQRSVLPAEDESAGGTANDTDGNASPPSHQNSLTERPSATRHRGVHKGYSADDRRALNREIETSGDGSGKP